MNLTVRTLRLQYRQTILGYAWVVLSPLTQLFVLYFVFSGILGRGDNIDNYIVVLALGFFAWHLFSQGISGGSESLTKARNLIGSISLPRDFLVISAVLSRILDFLVVVFISILLLIVTGESLSLSAFWVPPIFLCQLIFTVGLVLPLAALNVFYHDVRFLLSVVMRVWFWVTPIFYTVREVPDKYQFMIDLNPLARFIDAYRVALLSGSTPAHNDLIFIIVAPCVTMAVGYFVYSKLERTLVDRA